MASNSSKFLTKNHLGIYQFQTRIPKYLRDANPNLPHLFRKSLRTRDPRLAAILARRWAVAFESASLDADTAYALRGLQSRSIEQPFEITQDTPRTAENAANVRKAPTLAPKSTRNRISEALEVFISEKRRIWNPKAINGNERSTRLKVATFIEIVGDCFTDQLRIPDVVKYKNTILKLPSNRSKIKQYRRLSIDQLLQIEIPEDSRLSIETLMGHFNKVSGFLDWCANNALSEPGLKSPLRNTLKKSKSADLQRDAFSATDLGRLFGSEQYLIGTHRAPSHYFVPLLGLFTGARQNELCQLYRSDVYKDPSSNIWVIDINANTPDKRLKKLSHARMVPIHPILIQLGFIDYVSAIQTERVFPELRFKRDGYGQTFSRWFNEQYRSERMCNVGQGYGESKNFHSFRHTFITKLVNDLNLPQHKVAHIVGHRPSDSSETIQRYTKASELADRASIIDSLKYEGFDPHKIAPWDTIKTTVSTRRHTTRGS